MSYGWDAAPPPAPWVDEAFWDAAIGDGPSVQALVAADLAERDRGRIVRYDGDPLRDSYQHVLNLACSMRQAIADRDKATS